MFESSLSNGYQGFFPWVLKRPGRESDHSPHSSVEVNNALTIPPRPNTPCAWCSVKVQELMCWVHITKLENVFCLLHIINCSSVKVCSIDYMQISLLATVWPPLVQDIRWEAGFYSPEHSVPFRSVSPIPDLSNIHLHYRRPWHLLVHYMNVILLV
jgi:hypothetical protein